jgi:osmotically inducible lipoprotein OsmB
MMRSVRIRNIVAGLLIAVMLTFVIPTDAQAHHRRHRRPSRTKHIVVGTAAGAVGGALIGGRKGALIGAGAGAGTGYLVYRHKKRKHRRY